MTVEELLELKRKADAIAEIEKTVAKETNRHSLLLDNLKQIVKFIKDTLASTGLKFAEFKTRKNDLEYTSVGFHENGELYIRFSCCSDKEVNENCLEDKVTCRCTGRMDSDFACLADNWTRIKGEFLLYIKERVLERIKNSQNNIASMTEKYITAKEFRL